MELLKKLVNRSNLTKTEMTGLMEEIMTGKLSDLRIVAILVALHMKGETVEEITSAAKVMRQHAKTIQPQVDNLIDTCGTGGDNSGTFNISTAAAFVVAGAGLPVAKHGNRAASSKSGSADVLEALGVNINLEPEKVKNCIEQIGLGFMFAPNFHPAMKFVMPARKALGLRTIFNILGPLTNPAGALHQILGVFDPNLTETLAEVLKNLGLKSALVVHGQGLDEITLTGSTKITELKNGQIKTFILNPEAYGFKLCSNHDLAGGDAHANADIILNILKGESSPKADIVILNASAALLIADVAKDFKEGLALAKASIESGRALEKLKLLKKLSKI